MWRNLRALLILSALCFSHFAWAQPANDPCSSAINVTNLAGGCTTYDFTGATSDLANGSCTSAPTNPNIWFTFTAQGPDVTIVAKSGADNFEVTIVEFAPTPCVFANATEVACSVSPLNSTSLVAGTQYYVIISFPNNSVTSFQLCITNPVPPPIPANDSPCFPVVATPNGPCVNGTTVAATGDFANPACAPNFPSNSVWYTVALTGVNNVVNVSFANENITGDVSIMVGYFTGGCNGQFFLLNNGEYCGPPPTPGSPFSVTGIAGTTYYIQVGSSDAGAGTFAMCVTQNGPPPGCSGNDLCSNAAPFPALITSAAPICLTGCNIGAGPENTGLAGCYDFSSAPGIWYTFTTDANAANINMVLNSTVPGEIQNPQVALFSGSCAGLVPVTCNTGSMGNLSMVQVAVSPNTTYYVLVGNVSGNPGHFSLCLAATANTNVCVISSAFTVTSTSLGSPLAGPYLPGELVSFKFRINSFQVDPIGQGNNCQWLQAMVPIFGDCWDPTSFSADGEPITHTGPNPVYGAVWDWFPEGDVDYNFNSPYLKLFIDPNTGRLVLCHYLDPSCTSPGISGGDGLPAGWYAYRGTPDPDVTYGDGAGCGTTNGPYEVNFTLRTRNYDGPEGCSETGFHDCDVVMYTFADGETGSWSGSSSVCAQDQPKFLNRELNCCEGPTIDPIEKTICSGSSTAIEITSNQDPDVDYTFTVVPNGGVTGEASGTGKFLNQILINTTTTVKTVIWYVSGKKDGCTGQVEEIRVTVLPQLKAKITASPDTTGCAQSIFTLTANFTNNPSPPTSYLWSNNSTDPSIIVQPNLSTTFTVTVTDANGCSAVDDVTILIRPLFDVDVANNGDTIRCQEARPFLTITANPLGGAAPYTSYIWDTPIGNASGKSQVISTPNQTGLYTVTVTDKFGCTGTGTINVEIFPTPFINTDPFPDTICQGQGQLTMFGFIGVPGSVYWDNSGNNLVLYSSDEGDGNLRIFTNLIPAGNYNPIFIGESEDGCKDSIPMPFVVVAKPNLSLTPIDTLCAGTLPVPLIAAPSGGTWTGTGVVGNTFDPKIAGTGTFKLYYVFGACNAKDSMSVTVKTLPVVSVTLPGTGLYCKDQPMVIASALPTGGVWSGDIGANGEIDPITLMAGNYLVSYSYTDTKGCSNVDTDQYTIKPQITPAITGQLSFCNSLSTNLTGQGGFAGYTWTKPDSTTFSGSTIPANLPGVYNLTVTDAQGCTGTFAVNVVEYPEANPVISGSLTFCTGNYTTIGVGNGYVNYIWSNTEATAAIDVTIPGPYSVTITDNNGCKDSVSTIVSEASELTPVIGGLYEYCSGKSTVLDVGTGFTQMNWTTPVGTATGQMITAAIPGTYTVMVTDASGCTGDTTITVAENSLPVPVIAGAASICTGASTILNATNPNYVQYNWTLPGGGAGPNTPTIAANLAGSYVVTVTDTKGCVGTDNFDIAIVPLYAPAVAGDQTFCNKTSTSLNADNGYSSYTWQIPGAGTLTGNPITASVAGNYVVTVTDAAGCTGTGSIVVTELPIFSPGITGPNSFCINTTAQLQGDAGYVNYTWAGPNAFSSMNQQINITDGGNYQLTVTDAEGCTGTASFAINQTTSLMPDIAGGLKFCTGLSTTLNAGAYTGFSWVNQNNTSIGSGQTVIINQPGTYTVTVTDASGCTGTDQVSVTEETPPNAGNVASTPSVCQGKSSIITLSDLLNGADIGGQWSETTAPPSPNGAFNAVYGTLSTLKLSAGTYTFNYHLNATALCPGDDVVVSVKIDDLPTVDAGVDQLLTCANTQAQIGGLGTSTGPEFSYNWTEIANGTVITDPSVINLIAKFQGTYVLLVKNTQTGCEYTDTVLVSSNDDLITKVIATVQDPKCFGDCNGFISLTESQITGGTAPFEFDLNNAGYSSTANFTNLCEGDYALKIRDANGCAFDLNYPLVQPPLVSTDLGEDTQIEWGDTVQLFPWISIPQGDIGNVEISDQSGVICDLSDCYTLVMSPNSTTTYTVIVTDLFGCKAIDKRTVKVIKKKDIFVPTGFSPNDDGNNDVFTIFGNDRIIEKVSVFRVFSRWGELLFEANDFPVNEPSFGWDGTFKGKKMGQGVYVYMAEIVFKDNTKQEISGDVTITNYNK